jgi:RNA polymerase primary sigma factor
LEVGFYGGPPDSVSGPGALTPPQEHVLVAAAEDGDAEARCKLVETFMPGIAGLAVGFPTGAGIGRQELLQQGVVGLLTASRRYDPRLNTPFWAYASFWVRKAMQELVAELARPVVLSDRAVRSLARITKARRAYLQDHGTEPTNEELIEATDLTLEQLENLQAAERMPRAIEEPLGANVGGTVGDTIMDPSAERAFEHVLDQIEIREMHDVAGHLDDRERAVIDAHYGLGQPAQTFGQIGRTLGLTAERARQIEVGALNKLRATDEWSQRDSNP